MDFLFYGTIAVSVIVVAAVLLAPKKGLDEHIQKVTVVEGEKS